MRILVKYHFLLFLLFAVQLSFAQDFKSDEDRLKYANKLFEEEKYEEAAPHMLHFLSLNQTSGEFNFKYGVCVLKTDEDKSKSIRYLRYASKQPGVNNQVYFFLGEAYHLNYLFNDAIVEYQKFKSKADPKLAKEYEVDLHIKMCSNGEKLMKHLTELVVSDKKESSYERFQYSYDLSQMGGKILVSEEFQSKYDKKVGYRSLVYFPPLNQDVIFYSSYGKDGSTGLDLYQVKRLPNGGWSEPLKLPDHVNTPYDDAYAYLHPNGTAFYFCSKGHTSMGGYDVFKCSYDIMTNTFGPPVNQDYKINTPDDDIMYVVDSLNQNAYFASSRAAKGGYLDVYKVRVEVFPLLNVILAGEFINEINANDINATIKVENTLTGVTEGIYNPNNEGKYVIVLPKSGRYKLIVETPKSEKIHSGFVEIPPQKELKPLKQEILLVNRNGEEQLIIRNLFDQEVEDAQGILANVMKQLADPEVNADEFPDSLFAVNQNAVVDSVLSDDVNYSAEDLISMSSEMAQEAEDEAKAIEKRMNAAYTVANNKSKAAAEMAKKAQDILKNIDAVNNPLEKQQQIELANEYNQKAKDLNQQATTSLNLANKLEEEYNSKNQEVAESRKIAADIENALNENSHDKAVAELQKLKGIIENIISTDSSDIQKHTAFDKIVKEALDKQKEADKALADANQYRDEQDQIKIRLKNLNNQLENAKEKDKPDIQNQITLLEEEYQAAEEIATESFAKNEKLQKEADNLQHQADLLSNIFEEMENSGDVELSAEDKAAIGSLVNSSDVSNEISSNEDILASLPSENENSSNKSPETNEENETGSEQTADNWYSGDEYKNYESSISDIDDNLSPEEKAQKENEVYSEWITKLDKDIKETTDLARNTTDNAKKREYENRVVALMQLKDEKEFLLNKNNETLHDAGLAITSVSVNTNEETDYTVFQDELNETENITDDVERARKENQIAQDWLDIIDEDIQNAKDKLTLEEDPDKKKELEDQIKRLEILKSQKEDQIASNNELIASNENRQPETNSNETTESTTNETENNESETNVTTENVGENETTTNENTETETNNEVVSNNESETNVTTENEVANENTTNENEVTNEANTTENVETSENEELINQLNSEIEAHDTKIATLNEEYLAASDITDPNQRQVKQQEINNQLISELKNKAQKQKELMDIETDDEKKTSMLMDISSTFRDMKDREEKAQELNTFASNNLSSENHEVNSIVSETRSMAATTDDVENSLTAPSNYENTEANEVYNSVSGKIDELNVVEQEVESLKNDYESETKEKKKEKIAKEIEDKENEQHEKEIEIAEGLGKANTIEEEKNAENIQSLKEELTSQNENIENDKNYIAATTLESVSEEQFESAQQLRSKAEQTDDTQEKSELLKQATSLEKAAITNQNKSADILEEMNNSSYVADYVDNGNSDQRSAITTNTETETNVATENEVTNEVENTEVVENNEQPNNNEETNVATENEVTNEAENTEVVENNEQPNNNEETNVTTENEVTNEAENTEVVENNEQPNNNEETNVATENEVTNEVENTEVVENNEQPNNNEETNVTTENEVTNETENTEIVENNAVENRNAVVEIEDVVDNETVSGIEFDPTTSEVDIYTPSTETRKKDISELSYTSEAANETKAEHQDEFNEITSLENEIKTVSNEAEYATSEKEKDKIEKTINKLEKKKAKKELAVAEVIQESNDIENEVADAGIDSYMQNTSGVEESSEYKQAEEYISSANKLQKEAEELRSQAENEKDKVEKSNLLREAASKEQKAVEYKNEAKKMMASAIVETYDSEIKSINSSNNNELSNGLKEKSEAANELSMEYSEKATLLRDSANTLKKEEDKVNVLKEAEKFEEKAKVEQVLAQTYEEESEKALNKETEISEKEELLTKINPTSAEQIREEEPYVKFYESQKKIDSLNNLVKVENAKQEGYENLANQQEAKAKALENQAKETTDSGERNELNSQAEELNNAASENRKKKEASTAIVEDLYNKVEEQKLTQKLAISSLSEEKQEQYQALAASNLDQEPIKKQQVGNVLASNFVPPTKLDSDIIQFNANDGYSDDNPIPLNPGYPEGLIYKVQIGAFRKPIPQNLFKGFAPITAEKIGDDITRYRVGYFTNFNIANEAKNEIRPMGYPDAFVVAIYNGKRISIAEARQLENGNTSSLAAVNNNNNNSNTNNTNNVSNTNNNNNNTANTNRNNTVPDYVNNMGEDAASVEAVEVIEGCFYTVQIGAFSKPIKTNDVFNVSPLVTKYVNGLYKYSTGVFGNIDDANARKNEMVSRGLTDAFVTAYCNGEKKSVQELSNMIETQGTSILAVDNSGNIRHKNSQGESETNVTNTMNPKSTEDVKMITSAPTNVGTEYFVDLGTYSGSVPQRFGQALLVMYDYDFIITKSGENTSNYSCGAFVNKADAERAVQKFQLLGIENAKIIVHQDGKEVGNESSMTPAPVDGLIYRVFLGTYSNGSVPLGRSRVFLELDYLGIESSRDDNGDTYYCGKEGLYQDAQKILKEFVDKGVTIAKIVAFKDDQEIPVDEARKMTHEE